MATKKKRTMSAAQKKALAKGRAALQAKRKKSPVAKRKTAKKTTARKTVRTVTVSKGKPMAKRKAKRRSSGGVKERARRTVRRARGFLGKHSGVTGIVKDSALAVGGGIAAGVLANKLPITDPRMKAAAPIAAGIAIAATIGRKNDMAKGFATGMIVLGAVALMKQLAPNVPMLAGEEEMVYVPQYPQNALGYGGEMLDLGEDDDDDLSYMGENIDLGQEYYSPADL